MVENKGKNLVRELMRELEITPLIKLAWMSVRAVFGNVGNVHFSMSGFSKPSQRAT